MGDRLAGQVCVVTGANRGIGQAIAVRMAAAGATVVATGRSEQALAAPVAELAGGSGQHLGVSLRVADEESVAALGATVLDWFGHVDTVVANAGIAGPTAALQDLTLAQWRETTAVDLDGVFLTFRAFVPAMRTSGAGSLIAISSMTGKRPLAGRTPYAAAKMGVIGLVRTLATELGPHGVRVNAVCPRRGRRTPPGRRRRRPGRGPGHHRGRGDGPLHRGRTPAPGGGRCGDVVTGSGRGA